MNTELLKQVGESAGVLQGSGSTWAIVTILVGAVICFLGYKLVKVWITLGGALIGFLGGYYITSMYSKNTLVAAVVAILAAIIMGMIAYNVYLIGVFLLCGIIGLCLSSMLIQPNSSMMFFICVIIGVAAGALGMKFVKPMVILSTSFQGGLAMATGIVALTKLNNDVFHAGIGIAIGLFGCLLQFLVAGHKEKKDKEI